MDVTFVVLKVCDRLQFCLLFTNLPFDIFTLRGIFDEF